MIEILKKMHRFIWLMFGLGFLGGMAILACWLLLPKDELHFTSYIIAAICLASLISLGGLIFCYVATYKIEKVRHLADLKATDIVGNDIGAAYDFGEIGLIITDDRGNIIWLNNLLLSRGINLVDYSINDLSPKLYEVMMDPSGKSDSCTFSYNNRFYAAKYIKDADLFILRDDTIYQNLLDFNKAHAPVIGFINVDNYADIHLTDDQERAATDSSIRDILFNYFSKYNCLIKAMKIDYYILLLTMDDLNKMINDKFPIVQNFADFFKKEGLGSGKEGYGAGLTCSLGFGYGDKSGFSQNNELAKSALDVAMSRGGNQCVVAPFGENMKVFGGGNSESQQATSMVKIKTYARSFLLALEKASNVLIVPHINADMDAIGACLGVYSICCGLRRKKQLIANIVYNNQNVERSADAAVRATLPDKNPNFFKDVFVSFSKADELKGPDTLIIAVDHNRPMQSIYPDLYKGGEGSKIAVIDHHRKQSDSFQDTVFEHIDSSSSSTCELIALYLDSYPFTINVPDYIATLMLSGIYLDTQNFKVKTRISTHEAAIVLSRLDADENKARDFLKENYESFIIKSKILANVVTYSYGVLIAKAPEDEFVNEALLANVGNELTEIEGVQAVFSLGHTEPNTVKISSRGNGKVNCELLMMKLGGGGHFSQAACAIKNVSVDEAEKELRHILDQYLKDATQQSVNDEDSKGE
ncbi:MAG: DHH family phosphoesterase [Bacilli bacterium]|jgi:c-di-AMP phosphodiesterase-like protein|nr:DHH family phosphoesterase [Bacilli bacterium]